MVFILCVLFSFLSLANVEQTAAVNYSQNKCEIRDQKGNVQFKYNADTCFFLEDGGFIAYKKTDDSTFRVNSSGKIIWKKNLGQVLSIDLDKSKKTVLLLSQKIEKTFLCKALSKFLVRIDLSSGKTLSSLSGTNLLTEIIKIRTEGKKYFPLLSPVNKSLESKKDHDCSLIGALDAKYIKNSADKVHFDQDIFLYMDQALTTAYILSYDLKKIVWFYELDNTQEEIFKYFIHNEYIYILSFENFQKRAVVLRKISLLDKKTDWVKKIQLDSGYEYVLESEKNNQIAISFQTSKKDSTARLVYNVSYSAEITTSNSVPDLIDSSQLKTLSDFLKSKK